MNRLQQLLAEQDSDRRYLANLLDASNQALAAGDLSEANRHGDEADQVMARIRTRSAELADLVTRQPGHDPLDQVRVAAAAASHLAATAAAAAAAGHTVTDIADAAGVARTTVYRWLREHEERL